jgi:1-pyrroline-5-carboxylate dehydrogenase
MVTDTVLQVVTSQDYTLQVLLTYLKISGQKIGTNIITKHTQNCWKLEERFHAHSSANPKQVATGIVRGAFEFQGQKCSAASDLVTKSLWPAIKNKLSLM